MLGFLCKKDEDKRQQQGYNQTHTHTHTQRHTHTSTQTHTNTQTHTDTHTHRHTPNGTELIKVLKDEEVDFESGLKSIDGRSISDRK